MNQEHDHEKYDGSAMRLMEALSGVDEELLRRSDRDVRYPDANRTADPGGRKRKPLWQYTKAWAAVICLAVVGAVSWGGYELTNIVNDKGGAGSTGNAAAQPEAVDITAQDTDGQQAEGAVEEQIPMPSSMAEEACPEDMPKDDLNAFRNHEKERQESDGIGGASAGSSGGENIPEMENGALNQGEEKYADTMIDSESCLKLNAEKLTEEAARDMDGLGGYIPTKLPRGYGFESAYSNLDVQEDNVSITWTRGMDSIMVSVTLPSNAPATVDVNQPETYDERMYEIPFAETVPEEYRASVDNPVFAWEDMSLEIVRSRMIAREDKGDTNTPRGNFSVLFSDGVVLRFSGRGTAEEIWEMLCSCGQQG